MQSRTRFARSLTACLALLPLLWGAHALAQTSETTVSVTYTDPTTYEDGTPFATGDYEGVAIYCEAGDGIFYVVATYLPGDGGGQFQLAQGFNYTCYAVATANGIDSDPSNTVPFNLNQPNPPGNVIWVIVQS